jgi:LuxR family glucitol operon transcriptional activator
MSATRNTCFALISNAEIDFRNFFIKLKNQYNFFEIPKDVEANAKNRLEQDSKGLINDHDTFSDYINYIDFGDIKKILDSVVYKLDTSNYGWCKQVALEIERIIQIRNRVCHSRPLEIDDSTRVIDFSKYLVDHKEISEIFIELKTLISNLEKNPSYAIGFNIPEFWRSESLILNNLPIPEFDDTGFLGRKDDRANIKKLLKGDHPVITIVGEGGVGKTALALITAYDLLDDVSKPFEAIIWISLKTTALTSSGIVHINNSINNVLGIFNEISNNLGSLEIKNEEGIFNFLNEIKDYCKLYNILIIVDNLETISVGHIRDLMLAINGGSKLLLTSRIGVGEIEIRYPLKSLDNKSAAQLFRRYASLLRVDILLKLQENQISALCEKIFNSPLLVKWYVSSVSRGSDVNFIDKKINGGFEGALRFCFSNLFEKFSENELSVIWCLACARKPLTTVELHFLLDGIDILDLDSALVVLHNSSILLRATNSQLNTHYYLSESSNAYASKHKPPSKEFFKVIQDKLRKIKGLANANLVNSNINQFNPYFVRVGNNSDDRIVGMYLKKSLDFLRDKNYSLALNEVEKALKLSPSSSEAARIQGLIYYHDGDEFNADLSFQTAIEHDSSSLIAKYSYAMFLKASVEDYEKVLSLITDIEKKCENDFSVLRLKGIALNRAGLYEDSIRVHRKLLENIDNQSIRAKYAIIDQAIEAFRRFSEKELHDGKFENAINSYKSAFETLKVFLSKNHFDDKLKRKFAKLISDCISRKEFISNVVFLDYVINSSEKLTNGFLIFIPVRDEMDGIKINQNEKTNLFLNKIHPLNQVERIADSSLGFVMSLMATYGFVKNYEGKSYFFHKNDLKVQDDWNILNINTKVMYDLKVVEGKLRAVNLAISD